MHRLNLVKTHTTGTGSVHAQVLLNNKDIGMLYLSQDEAHILLKALRFGTIDDNVDMTIEHNILTDDDNVDEEFFVDDEG